MAKISFVERNKVINNYNNFISCFLLVYVSTTGSIWGSTVTSNISFL